MYFQMRATFPGRRLPPTTQLMLVAVLLAAHGATSFAFQPPVNVTAVPLTQSLRGMRAATSGVARQWGSQATKTGYQAYLNTFGKPLSTLNSARKQKAFKDSLKTVMAYNNNTRLKWTASLNIFSDMPAIERAKFLGFKPPGRPPKSKQQAVAALLATVRTPAEIASEEPQPDETAAAASAMPMAEEIVKPAGVLYDWSMTLPRAKSQGMCESCWAFTTAAAAEADHYLSTGQVVSLSEQQLVDCDDQNNGCLGGNFDQSLFYAHDVGIVSGFEYPYRAALGTCQATTPANPWQVRKYRALPANEAAMLKALKNGPIAVGIAVDVAFQYHGAGVYESSTCDFEPNHAVLIVGAGVDIITNTPYWIIRNSWGTSWGEGGYGRVRRNFGSSGMCNIAKYPYQVISEQQPPPQTGAGSQEPAPLGLTMPPDPPGPGSGCKTVTITMGAFTSLADVAIKYKTSIAQIQLDNLLFYADDGPLVDGDEIIITCPEGTWSPPYGVDTKNQALSTAPMVAMCPPASYAVQFEVKPSFSSNNATNSTWVGSLVMTCSEGSEFWMKNKFSRVEQSGIQTQMTGFTSATFTASWAVSSMFGVGSVIGDNQTFRCPPDTLITGFSAGGTGKDLSLKGFMTNLQFLCSNPFGGDVKRLRSFLKSIYPRIRTGLSCQTHLVGPTDTWTSIAGQYRDVGLSELVRANPIITSGVLPVGQRIFIPPCMNGVLLETVRDGAQAPSAAAAEGASAVAGAEALASAAAGGDPASAKVVGKDDSVPGVMVPAVQSDDDV